MPSSFNFYVAMPTCLFIQPFHVFHFQDLLLKACGNLAFFVWTHELLPFDILLLALIDRDEDPHALRIVVRTYSFCIISVIFV